MLRLLLILPLAIANPIVEDVKEYLITIDSGTLKSVAPTQKSRDVLDLSGLKLKSIERPAFENLPALKSLNLANNELTRLPEFVFSNLTNLEHLNLGSNNLLRLGNLFEGLDNLKVLNISSNPVKYIYSDLYGVPKTADVLVEDNHLISMFRYAFSSESLASDDGKEIDKLIEETEEDKRVQEDDEALSKVYSDAAMSDESKRDVPKNLRLKFCMSGHVAKSLEVLKENDDLGEDCREVKLANTINLDNLGIESFEKGWYKLQSIPLHIIDLTNNSISKITEELLNDLPSDVTYVNLAMNKIKVVEKDVIENDHLKDLHLGHNPIESIESSAFSKTKLTSLYLLNTSLKNVDFVASLPSSLKVLAIYETQVKAIPDGAFANLPNLLYLNLKYNRIKRIEPGAFRGLDSLDQLDLSWNKLKEIQSGAFNNLKKVRNLNLDNNLIETVQKGAFSGMDKLKRLNLFKNKISKITSGMFADLPRRLIDLDLSNNEIEWLESNSFSGHLSQMLSLAGNKLSSIPKNTFDLPLLRILILSDNRIEKIDADSYVGFGRLRQLHLNKNKIAHIRKGDARNFGTLFMLDLSENPFERLENGALHGFLRSKGSIVNFAQNKLKVIQAGVFEDV